MRRRQFLVFAGAAALASPAGAQSSGHTRRIAIFHLSGRNDVVSESGSASWRAFFAELRKWGFVEGRNLVIDRYAAESGHHIPKGLSDLLAGEPEAIVAESSTWVRGINAIRPDIPLVALVADPLAKRWPPASPSRGATSLAWRPIRERLFSASNWNSFLNSLRVAAASRASDRRGPIPQCERSGGTLRRAA